MPKWNRIKTTDQDQRRLRDIVNATPGMTHYGNRARVAVCLPVEAAELLAVLIAERGQSAGTVCAELLQKALKENA